MAREIRFHNTLTRQHEPFRTLEPGHARVYTCGPTVYNFVHIGNLRTFLFEDVLRRTLQELGYRVTQVMNLTDIDDKTIKGAARRGRVAARVHRPLHRRSSSRTSTPCGCSAPSTTRAPPTTSRRWSSWSGGSRPTATPTCSRARPTSASPPSRSYGRLSGVDLDEVKAGARVDADEYEKEDVRDFVLWKARQGGRAGVGHGAGRRAARAGTSSAPP